MTDWTADAACAGLAPQFDAWIDGESMRDREMRHANARRICAGCLVLAPCRAARDETRDFEVMAGYPAASGRNVPSSGKYQLSDDAARREVRNGTAGDRNNRLAQTRRDVVVELTAQGWSARQIAAHLRVTQRAVFRIRQQVRRDAA